MRPSAARRLSLAALLGLLAATMAGSAFAATIEIETRREGDAIEIRASARLDADLQSAWQVITDYGHFAAFIPDLRESRVIARQGAAVTVLQSGDAQLWLFRMPLAITFAIVESAPNRLHSRAVAGSMRSLESDYELKSEGHGVRLLYAGHVVPGFSLFGSFEERAVEHNVGRQLRALADEIERRHASGSGRPAEPQSP
jgi:hypothetical protein